MMLEIISARGSFDGLRQQHNGRTVLYDCLVKALAGQFDLVHLVYSVCLVQPEKRDKTDNNPLMHHASLYVK